MAGFTVRGFDPALGILGIPSRVRNVAGAGDALGAVREMQGAGLQQIKIIQHGDSEITIPDLERLVGG